MTHQSIVLLALLASSAGLIICVTYLLNLAGQIIFDGHPVAQWATEVSLCLLAGMVFIKAAVTILLALEII